MYPLTTTEPSTTPQLPGYDVVTATGQLAGQFRDFQSRVLLYLGPDGELPRNFHHTAALRYIRRLIAPGRDAADAAREVLVLLYGGGLHVPSPDFWRDDLGQLVYAAGDLPAAYATVGEAAAVLRVSRSRIHQLLQGSKPKLKRTDVAPEAPITRDSLRERWNLIREAA